MNKRYDIMKFDQESLRIKGEVLNSQHTRTARTRQMENISLFYDKNYYEFTDSSWLVGVYCSSAILACISWHEILHMQQNVQVYNKWLQITITRGQLHSKILLRVKLSALHSVLIALITAGLSHSRRLQSVPNEVQITPFLISS